MARNRSTALIAIGAAVFVVGAALTFLVIRKDSSSNVVASAPPVSPPGPVPSEQAAPVTGPGLVKVPVGKEAVGIQIPAVPGLAGFVKVNDKVNVYGTFKDNQPAGAVKGPPLAKLILSGVKVLAVTAPPPGVEAGTTTYLLALDPGDAEKVIYLASFEGIWMSLSADGAPNLANTPGYNASNVA